MPSSCCCDPPRRVVVHVEGGNEANPSQHFFILEEKQKQKKEVTIYMEEWANKLFPSPFPFSSSWDSLYTTELTNHAQNPSDRGTVWFDDSNAEAKMIEFLEDASTLSKQDTSFLDLGCGNGSLLFALRGEGWDGAMLGIDYSEQSIALAKQIAEAYSSRDDEDEEERKQERKKEDKVEFAVWNLLRGDYNDGVVLSGAQTDGWDIVLDKGTFDAISLSEEKDDQGRRICEGYKARVLRLVKTGGLFLVTSCNWTEGELEDWFGEGSGEVEGASFVSVGRVKYPSFSFGGVKGQTISTLCFQRR